MNFVSQIVRVIIDGNPNLQRSFSILAIDLTKVQSVVHALLNALGVFDIAFFDPVVHHFFDPSVLIQRHEAQLASEEFGDEEISLLLKLLNDLLISSSLLQQSVE
jgi:hypothetical protein